MIICYHINYTNGVIKIEYNLRLRQRNPSKDEMISDIIHVAEKLNTTTLISIGTSSSNTLPYSLDSMFEGCTSLKTVELSDGLVKTGSNMFENCTSLTSVILPETLTHVSGSTFKGCTALETVELPDSVTNINASAFNSCTALRNLKLSKNLVQTLI